MSFQFTQAQLGRLSALISVLLAPLDADSIDDWRRDSCRALGALVNGEQLYFLAAPLPGVDAMWTEGMSDTLRMAYSERFVEDEGTNRALRFGVTAFNQTSIVAGDWDGYRADILVNELFLPHASTTPSVSSVRSRPKATEIAPGVGSTSERHALRTGRNSSANRD